MVDPLHQRVPELGPTGLEGVRTLYEFDDRYTAPRARFASADDYYSRCSVKSRLGRITLPGLVVHAMDDPFIGAEPFLNLDNPPALTVELVRHGGHLGYLSRSPWMGTRRWLDSRLTKLALAALGSQAPEPFSSGVESAAISLEQAAIWAGFDA